MTRTRKVFPTAQVPHLWASSDLTEARNSQGNLFFTTEANGDRCLWSYGRHFMVGRITTAPATGERVALLTAATRSMTTSRHQAEARAAVRHLTRFMVRDADDAEPPAVLAEYQAKHNITMDRATRAKEDGNRPYLLAEAARILDEGRAFAAAFGLPDTLTECDLDAAAAEAAVRRKAKAARTRDEKAREALAREALAPYAEDLGNAWTREAYVRDLTRTLVDLAPDARKAHAETVAGAWGASARAEREAERAAAAKRLTEWRAGGSVVYGMNALPPALRVNGEEVETSWGASFPVSHAAPLWRAILTAKANGGREFNRAEDSSPKAGHFTVERITAEGDVVAGCHMVPFEECARLAADLGLTS